MSQRILIVGVSESGKSAKARAIMRMARAVMPEIRIFVRDPLNYEWEGADGYFESSEELRALMREFGTPAIVVIDECADFFKPGMIENHWIFTQIRHDATIPVAIGQRIVMMAPNVREMATDLFIFSCGKKTLDTLAEEYNIDVERLYAAMDFETGEHFHWTKINGRGVLTHYLPDGKIGAA